MKIINRIFKYFTIIIIAIICSSIPKVRVNASNEQSCYVVIEKTTGRVLFEHNSSKKAYMASTTKILTAICVIESFDIKQQITITKESIGVEGSSVYLAEGEIYTVEDLLYGLMLRSGNDCAETLAISLSGSIENFATIMNSTAKKAGANQSNFVNPHGLHDDNHYTTAYDLALITRYALNNSTFAKISSCKSYTATEITSNTKRNWVNKNKMLSTYDGATGVKTGFTKKAGRCLVSSAKRDNLELVCVVLNEQNHYGVTKSLLDEAFSKFSLVKLIDASKFDYSLPNKDKSKYYRLKIEKDFIYPISTDEKIEIQIDLPKYLKSKPSNGQKVGEIKIYSSKQLIFSQNIYTLIND